jgi:hypothetical protein
MDLNLREDYWIKFCMDLMTVTCLDTAVSFITVIVNTYSNRRITSG